MTLEEFLAMYLPLVLLLLANFALCVINYNWQKVLKNEMLSLAKKVDQGMAGILELDANETN